MTRRKAKGKRRATKTSKASSPSSPSDSRLQPSTLEPTSQDATLPSQYKSDDFLREDVRSIDSPTHRLTPRRAALLVATIAAILSLGSFTYFFNNDMTN